MSVSSAMTKESRSTSLSIRLDVIFEEDQALVNEDFNLPRVDSIQTLDAAESPVTHTITLRNFDQSNSSDPQFLHTGKWPTLDMVDDILNADNKSIPSAVAADGACESSPSRSQRDSPATSTNLDNWDFITANQLTMVMDYWRPTKDAYPRAGALSPVKTNTSSSAIQTLRPMIIAQQSLFFREVMEEHLTRAQTVEHMEELEDNDNAVEIVAILEGYRQNGWAEEMVKAFPRECWFFWTKNIMATSLDFGHTDVCDGIHDFNLND